MGRITEILQNAQLRAKAMNLSYEGALLPQEAFEILQTAPGARLVDVRCRAECDWVGRIPGAVEIEWVSYPGLQRNPSFLAELEQSVDKESLVLFICRTAQRSNAAAILATESGFADCYNILEGFEGEKNAAGQRRSSTGWCATGLPWQQG